MAQQSAAHPGGDIPADARRSFRIERRHLWLWSILIGATEANIAAIIAQKTFGASELLTGVVWAVPVFANTLNLLWGALIRGRRRGPMYILVAAGVLLSAASFGLNHPGPAWAGWVFAGQLALVHFFITGLVTIRASIWHANYPAQQRGQITGRLQRQRFFVSFVAAAAISLLFDVDARSYRLVYPIAAALGAFSLLPMRKMRIRGEDAELAAIAAEPPRPALARLRESLGQTARILREDRRFARYMRAQFLLGSANFFTDPVVLILISGTLDFSYFLSTAYTSLVPAAIQLVTIGWWSRLFDRVGVLRFRVTNTAVWIGGYVAILIAVLLLQVPGVAALFAGIVFILISRIIVGVCRGGGAIAWSLGHLHFSQRGDADLYMGIHVGLTGLRGFIMPLLGVQLFAWIGSGAIVLAVAMAVASWWMFLRLAQDERDGQNGGSESMPVDSA